MPGSSVTIASGQGRTVARLGEETTLTFSERLREIRTGFERPFWVANISELFERLSYYAAFASLARYLHETLNFRVEQASSLTGIVRGPGLVPGGIWRHGRRPPGLSPLSVAGLSHPELLLLSVGITGSALAGSRPQCSAAGCARNFCIDASRPGRRAGQALRRRHHSACFKRKCSLHWLFDLLHAGKHRRSCRALRGVLGAPAYAA